MNRGWVKGPGGVMRHVGTFSEPTDDELEPYRHSATLLADRVTMACGKVTAGRRAHKRAGTPMCDVCREAERQYTNDRRAAQRAAR